ncbi:MAG: Mut7-C RNAse domain-containing protein [Candidatus Caldatribacterium sp.]|uniref:Mut7-C RNAse domain-containing protein n=1 Tax=Candidatus Caldatribacterium sp. TaxID=2282143 RepID=UPI002996C478|nr:Mut7-C RNAse domain-containing protein [Candidatus Caldatribacterium sp.]MCX7730282.1 Mut7-C RNAse domain-containing protein [Candidatus Caldatribacterium sp.]MDW8080910.1 Mut7-C RNAse domain-containing protein [Candidatus Calescibacterium sp.]
MTTRFLADSMLGKLARWLRILGHDVAYFRDLEDKKLLAIARLEKRILLTKDRALAAFGRESAYLVRAETIPEQLLELKRAFRLSFSLPPRCPYCNEPLNDISLEEARKDVPLFVALSFSAFKRCPSCRRIFWPGTHWQRIQQFCQGFPDE